MKESSTIRSDRDNIYLEIDNISECSFQIWEEVEKKKSRVSKNTEEIMEKYNETLG